MNATELIPDTELANALARHIDEHHGDYPLVTFEDGGLRVVAMYKNTELEIIVDAAQANLGRRGKLLTELHARSVQEAILMIAKVEAIRQQRRYPMLRF